MASPFRYFRKHSKAFMATAAVVCMGLFVFGRATPGGRSANESSRGAEPVATWNGGSLNRAELSSLVGQRILVNEFLIRLFREGGGQSLQYELPPDYLQMLLRSNRPEAVEMAAIDTEVVASLATQAGMTVSDAMINHYLQQWGLHHVNTQTIRGMLASMGGQNGAKGNEAIIFNTLRKMLLAYFYKRSFDDASLVVLPEQRWDDWRRVYDGISLDAAIIPVKDFESAVPEPTEADLQTLFNEFKDADPDRVAEPGGREMPLPEPGFAEPRRVKLQFLLGSVTQRAEKLLPTVTDEEIADYYERNKRTDFVKMDLPLDEKTDQAKPDQDKADKPKAGDEKRADQKPAEQAKDSKPAATSEPKAPANGTGETRPGQSPKPGDNPSSQTDSTKHSLLAHRPASPFRLAAYQTKQPGGAQAGDAASAVNKTEGSSGTDQTADKSKKTDEKTEEKSDGGKKAGAADEKVEYEPLDKVRDDIRKKLATDKAVDELQRTVSEAAAQLQSEYNRYGTRVAEAEELNKPAPAPPEKLTDLTWLASKYGLDDQKTTDLTVLELRDAAVGKAIDSQMQRSVVGAAFTTLKLYEPILAKDLNGDWYLAEKIEDKPRRIPTFAEARDKVRTAWIRREAAKLAEKKAQELAAEAEKSSQSFEDFFKAKGYSTKQTGFFSWRSYPAGAGQGTPPILSEVPELKNVGPDFMDAAFNLDDNKTIGLLNFDHSEAYVVRLHDRRYTPQELRDMFLEEANYWPGKDDMLREHLYMFANASNKAIQERAGLKFDEQWQKQREERLANQQD